MLIAHTQVWRQQRQRGRWSSAWHEAAALPCLADEAEIAQARQRRRAPQNPSINHVAWTADDRRVSASCVCVRVCVSLCVCARAR